LVAIYCIDGVADFSGHCWHMDREVFVRNRKLWHVCSILDDTFSDFVFLCGGGISIQGQALHKHSTSVSHEKTTTSFTRCFCVEIPVVLSVFKRRASVSSTEGRRSRILSSSINPTFQVALLLAGYSTSASV
jgi:hypothetical protein